MSFINIINESFDKQNKKILEDGPDYHTIPSDFLYRYIFDAAKDLNLKSFDFDYDDSSELGTLTYIDHAGKKQQAQFEFAGDPYFPDKEDAKRFLRLFDWKVVDDEGGSLDENIFIKKQKRKPQKLKEDNKRIYKYIIVDHDDPENFMLVKSDTKLNSDDLYDWNFLDITDKHGKGIITWDDEYIDFHNSKSPEELDEIYRQALVKYLSDLDKKRQLNNIKDEYIVKEDLIDLNLIDEDEFLGLPDPGSGEDVVEAYREDKTLKNTYLSSLVSDFINSSYVDDDSSSSSQYVDIDDLNQYVDYKDFSDNGDEDKNNDSLDDEAKIEKLKHLDHIPDKFFADSQIKSIIIPDNIKSIGDHAFEWCDFLSKMTIPASVVKIGSGAFYGNEGLKTVTYKGTQDEWWNKIDFADDWDDECYIRKVKCIDGILNLQYYD